VQLFIWAHAQFLSYPTRNCDAKLCTEKLSSLLPYQGVFSGICVIVIKTHK